MRQGVGWCHWDTASGRKEERSWVEVCAGMGGNMAGRGKIGDGLVQSVVGGVRFGVLDEGK